MNNLDSHLVGRKLRERVGKGLGRAALIGLDDDPELLHPSRLDVPRKRLQ